MQFNAPPASGKVCGRRSITPKGHDTTQYPQPLQTSFCTSTEPTSVRTIDPVGHASRQPASSQCLQTSDKKTQRNGSSASAEATADKSDCGFWIVDCRLSGPIGPAI